MLHNFWSWKAPLNNIRINKARCSVVLRYDLSDDGGRKHLSIFGDLLPDCMAHQPGSNFHTYRCENLKSRTVSSESQRFCCVKGISSFTWRKKERFYRAWRNRLVRGHVCDHLDATNGSFRLAVPHLPWPVRLRELNPDCCRGRDYQWLLKTSFTLVKYHIKMWTRNRNENTAFITLSLLDIFVIKIYKTIIWHVLHACETWSLTQREERNLRVSENSRPIEENIWT
jgi:hypothetical protein